MRGCDISQGGGGEGVLILSSHAIFFQVDGPKWVRVGLRYILFTFLLSSCFVLVGYTRAYTKVLVF